MRFKLAMTAALAVITAPIMSMTATAQSSATAPATAPSSAAAQAIKQLDNDTLLQAYKQSISDASHGKYLDATFGMLKRLGVQRVQQINDPDVVDQWAQVMSCMTGVPTFNPAKGADFKVPAEQVADLRAADAVAAIPEIVRRAKQTSIVILDENHLEPRGRAFGLEVARALRPLGYTVLAAEALKRDAEDAASFSRMAKLAADGYPRQASGYYLDDPVLADFIRQSLALGYRPVAYESTRTDYAKDPIAAQGQREQDQADNLIRRAVKQYPDAKILVYVGEHHIAERPIAAEGGKVAMMAERLKRATGIDPLTIDQAGLSSLPMNRPDADLYAIAAPKAQGQSMVLMRHGKPLVVGLLAGSVDLQVVHPPTVHAGGRPDWLAIMHRKPVPVPQDLLPVSGTRLVQAFLASEEDDAIPVDQVLVSAGTAASMLMLPSQPVRYAVQDFSGGAEAGGADAGDGKP